MRPALNIPTTLKVDPDRLQGETDRLINGLYDYADQLSEQGLVRPSFPTNAIQGVIGASYDAVLKVSPYSSSTTITVQLPQAKTKDGGRSCQVLRTSAQGIVVVRPIGALLNGSDQFYLYGSVGITTFTFDGTNWWSSNPGYVPWSGL